MRRRWKALAVVLGAVGFLAALLFLLPPRDDGLDWIRKYGGQETVEPVSLNYYVNPAISPRKFERDYRGYRHTFTYRRLSSKNFLEINDRWPVSEFLVLQEVRLSAGKPDVLVIHRYEKRLWIERQWASVKQMLGFG